MGESAAIVNRRVLVIDDNPAIHKDFRKVLGAGLDEPAALEADEQALFGHPRWRSTRPHFEVDSALQGQEGVERVREALRVGRPYAMADRRHADAARVGRARNHRATVESRP